MIKKINLKLLKEKDKLLINDKEYEIVRIEERYKYNNNKNKVENKGKFIMLHKIGDKPLAVFPLFYYLIEDKDKLRFSKTKVRENIKFPKNMPEEFKHKSTENIKIPIKSIEVLK